MNLENIHKTSCSQCDKPLQHRLKPPVIITCPYCFACLSIDKENKQTFLAHKGDEPKDVSMLKFHQWGVYLDKPFEIIGRIRSVTTSSINNEWLLYVDSSQYYWLSENSLNYFIFTKEIIPLTSNKIEMIPVGGKIKLAKKEYILTEISKQISYSVYGEIPEDCYNDEHYKRYELISKDNESFASISVYGDSLIEASLGTKIDLQTLKLLGDKK